MRSLPSLVCATCLALASIGLVLPGCGDSASTGTPPADGSSGGACAAAGGFCLGAAACPVGYRTDNGALSCPPSNPLSGISNAPCCVPMGIGDASGGDAQPPKVTDYSIACAIDGDCVLIDVSTNACCGGCADAAIAKTDKARYDADRARYRSTCGSTIPCPPISCEKVVAICSAGKCLASPCSPTCPGADAGIDASGDGG